ncbi:hypothetical protein Vretimale_3674, partial [Volvox reticuliferus]
VEAGAFVPPATNHGSAAVTVSMLAELSAAAVTVMPLSGTETASMPSMRQGSTSTGALLAESQRGPQVAGRGPLVAADIFRGPPQQQVSAATVTLGKAPAGSTTPMPDQEPPVALPPTADTQQQGLEMAMLACRMFADQETAADDQDVQLCFTKREDNVEQLYLNRQEVDVEQPGFTRQEDDNAMAVDTEIAKSVDAVDQLRLDTVSVLETPAPVDDPATRSPIGPAAQRPSTEWAVTAYMPSEGKQQASTRATGSLKAPTVKDVVGECKALVEQVSKIIFPTQETGDDGQEIRATDGGNIRQLVGQQLLEEWRSELDSLRGRCKLPSITIGVVGNTGAGKSSLLNVLLGEEDILPTNGMRASTGCPIEVAFAPSSTYRAEIEFMTRAEWERCLEHLLSDLRDEDGGININDSRCEAAAAQAMLEAVYGREVIRRGILTFEKLRDYSSKVTDLLGTSKVIRHSQSQNFRREIGEYVDSHNKAGDAQPWPIVKVCRIQHNWKLLSGGAVLVDLPGVRDANEARGAVAEGYMKNLKAVWVVSDIIRAVDDKTAKDLLGSTFKRQLVLDGRLKALTFVCTKTDNIQVTGTEENMGGPDEVCALSGVTVKTYMTLKSKIERLLEEQEEAAKDEKDAQRKVAAAQAKCIKAYKAAKAIHRSILDKRPQPLPEGLGGLMRQLEPPTQNGAPLKKTARRNRKNGGSRRGQDTDNDADEDAEGDEDGNSTSSNEYESDEAGSSTSSDASEQAEDDDDPDYCEEDKDKSEEETEEGDDSNDGSEESDPDATPSEEDSSPKRRGTKRKRSQRSRSGSSPARKPRGKLQAQYVALPVSELVDLLRQEVQEYSSKTRPEYMIAVRERKKAKQALAAARQRLVGPQREITSYFAIARNNSSRQRLQQNFKDGLKEVFNAQGVEARVHDGDGAIGCSNNLECQDAEPAGVPNLPVFCVSAREAQKLEGRNKRDGRPTVFMKTGETEVPALRKHVEEIADSGRIQAQEDLVRALFGFINSVGEVLLSKRLDISLELARELRQTVFRQLQGLKARLTAQWEQQFCHMRAEFMDQSLTPGLSAGFNAAARGACSRIQEYGKTIWWNTYWAVIVRNGAYASPSAKTLIDFNDAIVGPLSNAIAEPWDRIFHIRFPRNLSKARAMCLAELDSFEATLQTKVPERFGIGPDRLDALCKQVRCNVVRRLDGLLQSLAVIVDEKAKELNREVLLPTVRDGMLPAYEAARREPAGRGRYIRLKTRVEEHVRMAGTPILRAAAERLRSEVKRLLSNIDKDMLQILEGLVDNIKVRLALLWDKPLSTYAERVRAAIALHQPVCAARALCRQLNVEVREQFALPPPLPAEEDLAQDGYSTADERG